MYVLPPRAEAHSPEERARERRSRRRAEDVDRGARGSPTTPRCRSTVRARVAVARGESFVHSDDPASRGRSRTRRAAVLYYTIFDPQLCAYGVANQQQAIANLVRTQIRSEIGKLALEATSRRARRSRRSCLRASTSRPTRGACA